MAVYGYTWLHKKNRLVEIPVLELPVTGKYISITNFSTYWKNVDDTVKAKIGAEILPVAHITLDQNTNASGAMRIYFHNDENEINGDPVTLTIKDGKFIDNGMPNIKLKDDRNTVEIISSDGFHQEGDFNAYNLNENVVWRVIVLEASSASVPGKEFQNNEIINIRIEPKRK